MSHRDTTLKVTKDEGGITKYSQQVGSCPINMANTSLLHNLFLMSMILSVGLAIYYLFLSIRVNKCFLNLVKSIGVVAGVRICRELSRLCGRGWLDHNWGVGVLPLV